MSSNTDALSCKPLSNILAAELLLKNKDQYGEQGLGFTIMELTSEACELLSKSNRNEWSFDLHKDWKVKFVRKR